MCALLFAAPGVADTDARDAIRAASAEAVSTGMLDDIRLDAPAIVDAIYANHDYAPLWAAPSRVESFLAVALSSDHHGLNPEDYRPDIIAALPVGDAGRELIITDSLVRLVRHLRHGKANSRPPETAAVSAAVESVLEAHSLSPAVAALAPPGGDYAGLQSALARYRDLAAAGGWPAVPAGPTIRPGARGPRVDALAARLIVTDDLTEAHPQDATYGAALEAAVLRFQARHGLETDALVGRRTLRALNVTAAERVAQLRVNLERARWMEPGLDDVLLVNVAAFRARIVRDGADAWSTRVIVGDREDQTPLIRSALTHVVFNPTWTLPQRIAREEMLPVIKQDPGFFERGGYELYDPDGNRLDPTTVDWARISTDYFPFTLVQRPGPLNQLGRIKFLFPNEHAICMHDTPARHLFARSERAFSHGCVRVEEPMALAVQVLDGWSPMDVDAQIRSDETRTVSLPSPLPLRLVYRTAAVDDNGELRFFDDIYERDAAVLAALDRL